MSTDITIASAPILPVPATPLAIRVATAGDLAFIDALQKKQTKQVGWMPAKQLESKIEAGHVLVAEAMGDGRWEMGDVQTAGAGRGDPDRDSGSSISHLPSRISHPPTPVGYCISRDQYMKRDDVGIIYQLNVVPGMRRALVGASLIKAVFERAAYGCRLFCCWCAQDIEANRFWESIGFVPLAFRTGSRGGKGGKGRTHIFWQRRVRAGDETTPYWYPAQTSSGAIREDRLVLPIPPGVHWSAEMPRILPGGGVHHGDTEGTEKRLVEPQITQIKERRKRPALKSVKSVDQPLLSSPCSPCLRGNKALQLPPAGTAAILVGGRIKYVARRNHVPDPGAAALPAPVALAKPKRVREPKPAAKHERRQVAAARELRDRWLEQFNQANLLPAGKYEVGREGEGRLRIETRPREVRLLCA